MHKSGFVNIVGRPNVGKSTLMNALVGERMSIITSKPQTTRHRIKGILSGDDFQLVFSDTPGFIEETHYKMQDSMNKFVSSTFEDADTMLFVIDKYDKYEEDDPLVKKLKQITVPKFLVINKIDLSTQEETQELIDKWMTWVDFTGAVPISALNKLGTEGLLKLILENTKEGPAYYPKDQLTDRSERFFISEIIRENLLEQYKQEIPYSCQVVIDSFKEGTTTGAEDITRIEAHIYVMRKSQKPIVIGKGGQAIKKLGIAARHDIEKFLESKVHLELVVKIKENWRDDERTLKHFGY